VRTIKKYMHLTIIFILLLSISLLFNTECTAYTNSFVISDNTPCDSYLSLKAIDNSTGKEIKDVILSIEIVYDPPYEDNKEDREFFVNLSYLICIGMPSTFYTTRALIKVKVEGYQEPEPVILHSDDYWNRTSEDNILINHTFYLDPINNNSSKTLDNNINSDENVPGFVIPLLISALIVVILLEKRKV